MRPHQSPVITKSELLALVKSVAASQAEIGRILSLAPARITEMLKGGRDLSYDEARKLIEHYGLEGEAKRQAAPSFEDAATEHGFALIEEIDLALGMGASYLDADHQPESLGMVPFKMDWLRDIHRGALGSLKVVRGRGDSMEPTIRDGDFVLVDMSQRRISDQDLVWAVVYGQLGMVRRLRQMPSGGVMLMPDNPVIRPIEAHDGEMAIMGRVIWIGRRM